MAEGEGSGYLEILNVGAGDIKITWNRDDPAELIRAKRIVKDLIRRGFALLLKEGDTWVRAHDFDEKTDELIIADFVPEEAFREPTPIVPEAGDLPIELAPESLPEPKEPPKKGNGRRTRWKDKRVKVGDAKVTAVGRSAGG